MCNVYLLILVHTYILEAATVKEMEFAGRFLELKSPDKMLGQFNPKLILRTLYRLQNMCNTYQNRYLYHFLDCLPTY